ncbi:MULTISPECIES: DUF2933 domain-containing protein [Cupriavidus]
MKCNVRTMVTTGVVLVAILATAYVLFPPVRALVLGAGPYLLLLLCPLSMWFMMKSMSAHDDQLSSMTEERSEQKPQPFRIKE